MKRHLQSAAQQSVAICHHYAQRLSGWSFAWEDVHLRRNSEREKRKQLGVYQLVWMLKEVSRNRRRRDDVADIYILGVLPQATGRSPI